MKDTIPMWPVQKEGFKDGKGFPSGTVTFPDLATSPDCEMIASGVNQKQPNAVAIGRQGNFLHWGFSASPDHMTEEAKLVFVNAIHYIKKFEGQAPVVRKVDRLVTRPMLDSFMWTISDEGFAATQSVFGKNSQSNSTGSSERMKLLKRFIQDSIIEEFQEDWAGCASYFDSNRPYLFPAETGSHLEDDHAWQVLVVDDDAKSLGSRISTRQFSRSAFCYWKVGSKLNWQIARSVDTQMKRFQSRASGDTGLTPIGRKFISASLAGSSSSFSQVQ